MDNPRVLLVEDHEDNLEILTIILSEKYRVSSYTSGLEALAAFETVKPDVVVLDIGMGPVDGLECLKTIRAMPGYHAIPAVALTAFAGNGEREAFLAAGFQAVVTKPLCEDSVLITAIESLLAAAAVPSQYPPSGERRG